MSCFIGGSFYLPPGGPRINQFKSHTLVRIGFTTLLALPINLDSSSPVIAVGDGVVNTLRIGIQKDSKIILFSLLHLDLQGPWPYFLSHEQYHSSPNATLLLVRELQ